MKYIDLKNNLNDKNIQEAGGSLKQGNLVLFPTETVYGIGANGLNENAVKKIFIAKGRASDNPLILHISNMDMLNQIAQNISELEYKLMHAFWPGPFTIILEKTPIVPNIVTGNLSTVGVRMPSNEIAKKLISYANVPIAAPSANISGRPSGTNIDDIFQELSNKVEYILDDGPCQIGLESTVVRVVNNVPHILRPGKVTPEEIEKVAGKVIIDKNILKNFDVKTPVLSPGMKYRHYAPDAKCVLVYSNDNDLLVKKIESLSQKYSNPLLICSHENFDKYTIKNKLDMGSISDLEEISKNIFTLLRKVDTYIPSIVFIEGVKKEGIGLAIMNRLLRACEYHYIEI